MLHRPNPPHKLTTEVHFDNLLKPTVKNDTFYQKLTAAGKKKKVAIVAVMRKLIVILNAMIKNNTSWQQKIA